MILDCDLICDLPITVCLITNVLLTLQSANAELTKLQDELSAGKKEQSSLQAKVIQLTTALKSILATKVGLNVQLFIIM